MQSAHICLLFVTNAFIINTRRDFKSMKTNFIKGLLPLTAPIFAALLLCSCGRTETTDEAAYTSGEATAQSSHSKEETKDSSVETAETAPADTDNQQPSTDAIGNTSADTEASTFAAQHGALHVEGTQLTDQYGEPVRLYGMSTHGLSFYPEYVNLDTFTTLRDDWNTNCVRLAMYTAETNGYCTGGDRDNLKSIVKNGVEYATELGMYVIIDWHILSDCDPNIYKQDAIDFFSEMSETYAGYDNVLYEICNEPNGYASWDSVKSYADEVIPCIRANDPDSIILVGSPTWSQDIDKALAEPLDYDNVMYTLHFYAGTHKDDLRNRLESCVSAGLPVFVSEFGTCDASGNGGNDFDSTEKWLELLERYNISFMCWNLANKNESSSVIRSDTQALYGWSEDELSEAGKWIRNYWRTH
jgi:endoglucanase